MSRVDELINDYQTFVELPWLFDTAPAQRVWMAVYTPEEERRLRLQLPQFEIASKQAGYGWELIDISYEFERWMADHKYRDRYFADPNLIQTSLVGFFERLVENVRDQIAAKSSDKTIIGLIGGSNLFGLGDQVRVSKLIERVQDAVEGRLLVFLPGEVDGSNFRLLGAREGFSYLATIITAQKG